MPVNTDPRFIGRAWITPADPVVAGARGRWTITFEVGTYGYDERARIKIASRFASDWGKLTIQGRVVGTAPIERVDVFRGLETIHTVSPYTPASFDGSRRYRVAWAGSRVRGRDRLTTWDGHLALSAGRIVDATVFAMENPEKGIVSRTADRLEWRSNTTGDDDGVDITVEEAAGAVLHFRTPIIDLDVPLADLDGGGMRVFPAGGVDLRVFMRQLPVRDQTRDLSVAHVDTSPMAGRCHAYWIRVTQEDGAQAWTSPVYLDAR